MVATMPSGVLAALHPRHHHPAHQRHLRQSRQVLHPRHQHLVTQDIVMQEMVPLMGPDVDMLAMTTATVADATRNRVACQKDSA